MFQFAFVGIGAGMTPIVAVPNSSVTNIRAAPAIATAGFRMESTGDYSKLVQATYTDLGDWIVPKDLAGAGYECRATLVSGTLSSGTTGSWLALNTNREWTVSASSTIQSCSFTLEIRDASSLVVLSTCTIDLHAESS